MSLLSTRIGPDPVAVALQAYGALLIKDAGDTLPSYAISGMLYLSPSGWLLLSVPNSFVRGAFSMLDAPGVELPPSGPSGKLEAHVSVMTKAEVDAIGPEKISERGKTRSFSIGRVIEFEPEGWPGVDRVWAFRVHSPELQDLRRSYGLSSLPAGGERPFHITLAVRRRGTLARGARSKTSQNPTAKAGGLQLDSPEVSAPDQHLPLIQAI